LAFATAALLSAATAAWCDPSQPDAATLASAPDASAPEAEAPAPAPDQPDDAAAPSAAKPSAVHRVKAELAKIAPRVFGDRLFAKAEKEFPAFCHDWGSKLRDRERNNIEHLTWKDSNGLETSIYTGYGNIQSCTCKQSSKGIPVGKLFYQEFEYRLEGKTQDEALHATPKPDTVTNTTEIFRWDKKQDKWIY
jgi:hypothetical protein